MKRIYLLIILFVFLVQGCKDTDFKKFESANYFIDYSSMVTNKYKINDTEFIMPLLPNGLFLYFDSNVEKESFLPVLDYQGRYEDVDFYPKTMIKKIFQSKDCIQIDTDEGMFKISLDNIYSIEKINCITGELIYDFSHINQQVKATYVHNIFGLQDKKVLKKYHVDYATPKINGIVWIGLTTEGYYFGKTIYSYFILKNDELDFFYDAEDFSKYCKNNLDQKNMILTSKYFYDSEYFSDK